MIDYAHWIRDYGYWAVAVFCFLEGETVLALAGIAAHEGHLELPWVVAIAAAAGWCGDQCFFWVGRRHGDQVLARVPSLGRHADRLQRLVERYQRWVIVLVRFAYGLRIAGPILIGTTRVGGGTFAAYNAIGAVLWGSLVAAVGWLFGAAVGRVLGSVHDAEAWLFGAAIAVAIVVTVLRQRRTRRR